MALPEFPWFSQQWLGQGLVIEHTKGIQEDPYVT